MKRILLCTALLLLLSISSVQAFDWPIGGIIDDIWNILFGPFRVDGVCYDTFQEAYNAVPDGGVIQCREGVLIGGVTSSQAKSVTLSGGWAGDYFRVVGRTTITGDIVMLAGQLTFQNCILDRNNTILTYPYVSIISPSSGDTFTEGSYVQVVAEAGDPDGTVSKVEFYRDATWIGTATKEPWTCTWNDVPAGGYSLTARVFDNDGHVVTSNSVGISILKTADMDVGFTPGNFAVNDLGGATYSIPIAVSPGTAGMTPEITLNFNSQSGSGLLGKCWDIGGPSFIARTGRTIAQDGAQGGVNMNTDDRLMLDGRRLINYSGAYWGVGTEYRTEVESYTKVAQSGDGFVAYKKSGEIMYFGTSFYERVHHTGLGGNLMWALSSVHDRFGNYIQYKYHKTDGRLYPSTIEYTMNDAQGLTEPFAYVEFVYEDRSDTVIAYSGGHQTILGKRLKEIQVFNEGGLVRKYVMDYYYDPSNGRSILSSVSEEDGLGNALPPHVFTYQYANEGFVANPCCNWQPPDYFNYRASADGASIDRGWRLVDADGNGQCDLIKGLGIETIIAHLFYSVDYEYDARFRSGTDWAPVGNYNPPTEFTWTTSTWYENQDMGVRMVDLNGDGLTDIVKGHSHTNSQFPSPIRHAWLNSGSSWPEASGLAPPTDIVGSDASYWPGWDFGVRFVDLNGDGLTDIIQAHDNYSTPIRGAWINAGTHWAWADGWTNLPAIAARDASAPSGWDCGVRFVHLNNDGLIDMIQGFYNGYTSQPTLRAWFNTGSNWEEVTGTTALEDCCLIAGRDANFPAGWEYGVRFVDLNGDGLSDAIKGFYDGIRSGHAWLNRGNSWIITSEYAPQVAFAGRDIASRTTWSYGTRLIDLNADGLVDLAYGFEDHGAVDRRAWLNTGQGFIPANVYAPPVPLAGRDAGRPTGWDYGVKYGDLDGDGFVDIIRGFRDDSMPGSPFLDAWLNTGSKPLLVKVENGAGKEIAIDYKPLTDPAVYDKGTTSGYPNVNLPMPMYVVSEYSVSDGYDDVNTLTYKYRNLLTNKQGRGMLGFQSIEIRDNERGSLVIKNFHQGFPFTGLLASTDEYRNKSGTMELLSHMETDYSQVISGGIYRIRSDRIYKYEREYNDLAVTKKSTTEFSNYDEYDNARTITVNIENGDGSQHFRTVTDNVFTNDAANWILARLTSTTVTHSLPDESDPDIVRHSTFSYYPATGALRTETIEPGSQYELTTTYDYDPFGNKRQATVTGYDIASRTTRADFDNRGRFAIHFENELGHVTEKQYDGRFGLVDTIILDPDGVNLVTTHEYDGFGRLIRTDRPDGTYTTVSYNWDESHPYAVYTRTTQSPNLGPPVTEYYDCLDRVIRTETVDRFGRTVLADIVYDHFGRLLSKSDPYFVGESQKWMHISYDEVDRPKHITLPDDAYGDIYYDGLITTRTENGLVSTKKEVDVRGNLITVVNDLGDSTKYEYDAVGNQTVTIDAHANRVVNVFDPMGHRTSTVDPDMGEWTYYYNALGEVWKQIDAKGQTTTFEFDPLGRMKKRVAPEGNTDWTYDTRFIGQLSTVTSPDGYARELYYDGLGRVTTSSERIENEWYEVHTAYDSYGRAETVTYPDCGNGAVKVFNVYTATGFANELRDPVANSMYWKALDGDASGRLKQTQLGNGITTNRNFDDAGRVIHIESGTVQELDYIWDDFSNLRYRYDRKEGTTEEFIYDDLHRLKTWTKGVNTASYDYDAIGNITYKSDVGSYSYAMGGIRPHAVASAGAFTYEYDDNGNMISNSTGNQQKTIAYTSHNKPSSITQDGNYYAFKYGSSYQRVLKSGPLATTTYIGDIYEKVTRSDMVTHRYYIAGGTCLLEKVAAVEGQQVNWFPDQKKYVLKDHLGSTHVVTDGSGNVIEKYVYAPFGKQDALIAGDYTRGFTGHEHDDEFGLINMKARMYDPVLGRFLSPDPTGFDPSNGQSLNRYSYVLNNPLRYTDPSGYFLSGLIDAIGDIVGSIAGAVGDLFELAGDVLGGIADAAKAAWENPYIRMAISIYVGCAIPVWLPSAWAPTLKFAIAGAASAAISSGGDPKTILLGAVTGAAFYQIGSSSLFGTPGQVGARRVAAHAFVGGMRSELQGGKFIHGALSAGITKFTAARIDAAFDDNVVGGAITSGVVAGTVSKMSGGKFENGFYTGAMAYTFNQASSRYARRQQRKAWLNGGKQAMMERAKFRADVWAMENDMDMELVAFQLYTCGADGPSAGLLTEFMTEANWFAAYVHDIKFGATLDWRNGAEFHAANEVLTTLSESYAVTYGLDVSKSVFWGRVMTIGTDLGGGRAWNSEYMYTRRAFPDAFLK